MVQFISTCISPHLGAAAAKSAIKLYYEKKEAQAKASNPKSHSSLDNNTITNTTNTNNSNSNNSIEEMEVVEASSSFMEKEDLELLSLSALSNAAIHAKILSDSEEMQIKLLTTRAVQLQLEKIQLKIRYFDAFDKQIEGEAQRLKDLKEKLASDKQAFFQQNPNLRPK